MTRTCATRTLIDERQEHLHLEGNNIRCSALLGMNSQILFVCRSNTPKRALQTKMWGLLRLPQFWSILTKSIQTNQITLLSTYNMDVKSFPRRLQITTCTFVFQFLGVRNVDGSNMCCMMDKWKLLLAATLAIHTYEIQRKTNCLVSNDMDDWLATTTDSRCCDPLDVARPGEQALAFCEIICFVL